MYQEEYNTFSKNAFTPLKGDFDRATFEHIKDSHLYKDKNSLYRINGFKSPPLEKVEIEGVDMATLEGYNHLWLTDKNKVYFDRNKDIVTCDKIDRASFKAFTYYVAKDKNNVYYNSQHLASDGKSSTQRADYKILEGAHAPSFHFIDNGVYKDKNQEWTIER